MHPVPIPQPWRLINQQGMAKPIMTQSTRRSRATRPPRDRATGLLIVDDSAPGITRRRAGTGFSYRTPDGTVTRDPETLARIRALAIPPAWTDVWISPHPDGHIQATGRDDAGRKQYRYHARWQSTRSAAKFARLAEFGRALPAIRERVDSDLRRTGLPRERVLATAVRLLESTAIRIGNASYERTNNSFGLTTLKNRHVRVTTSRVAFSFRGKSGKWHAVDVQDERLARAVARIRATPGQALFQYLDEAGDPRRVHSHDVNAYLQTIAPAYVTAKDFRTWVGSLTALELLLAEEPAPAKTTRNRQVVAVIDAVALRLGNTRAVARSSYIHPSLIDAFLAGTLAIPAKLPDITGLTDPERALVAIIEQGSPATASAAALAAAK